MCIVTDKCAVDIPPLVKRDIGTFLSSYVMTNSPKVLEGYVGTFNQTQKDKLQKYMPNV